MSDILIRGVEIPQYCGSCFFNRQTHSRWKCVIAYPERWKDFGNPREKPTWCPIIPALPHGRLIDADALKELISEQEDWLSDVAIHAFYGLLNKMPTIIPASK